jgi:tetratricopeptide (TPR) repeat protein
MRRVNILSALTRAVALFIFVGCSGLVPHAINTEQKSVITGLMSLDEAISGATAAVEERVQGNTEIAVSKIDSPLFALSDFLNDELSARFSVNGILTILARGKELERVDTEHNFQMSGLVSDESAVGIGHYLGAKVVITGTFDQFGNFSQLRIRAIEVRTARVLAIYSARINNDDVILASVTQPLETIKPVVVQENALAHLNQGIDFYAEGKMDAAIAEFSKALSINADLSNAFFYRGNAYAGKGEYDRTIADYNAALKINPIDTHTLTNRGNAFSEKGEYEKAIADYTAALRIEPNLAETYYNRGILYDNKDEYDRAIDDFTVAIKINPNYVSALNNRGTAYGKKGEYDRAIMDFTAVLRINPNHASALGNRGFAHDNKGEYDRAIADYTDAIKINPNYTMALNNRGYAYYYTGDLNRAIADFESVLRIDPSYAGVKKNLEILRNQRGY